MNIALCSNQIDQVISVFEKHEDVPKNTAWHNVLDTFIDCIFTQKGSEELDSNGCYLEYHCNVQINFVSRQWEAGFAVWTSEDGMPVEKEIMRVNSVEGIEGIIIKGFEGEPDKMIRKKLKGSINDLKSLDLLAS